MNPIHPDDARHQIQIRQEIIRDGIIAARNPGDLAALRESIGQMLIRTGERIRGHQQRATIAVQPNSHVTQLAR